MPDEFLAGLTPQARAEAWAERLSDPDEPTRTLVATRPDGMVGFCTVGPSRMETPEGYGELQAINILVTAQHQGLGGRLVRAAAAQLADQGYSAMTLSTLRDNAPARMFYEALGGTLSGSHHDIFDSFSVPAVEYRWPDIKVLL